MAQNTPGVIQIWEQDREWGNCSQSKPAGAQNPPRAGQALRGHLGDVQSLSHGSGCKSMDFPLGREVLLQMGQKVVQTLGIRGENLPAQGTGWSSLTGGTSPEHPLLQRPARSPARLHRPSDLQWSLHRENPIPGSIFPLQHFQGSGEIQKIWEGAPSPWIWHLQLPWAAGSSPSLPGHGEDPGSPPGGHIPVLPLGAAKSCSSSGSNAIPRAQGEAGGGLGLLHGMSRALQVGRGGFWRLWVVLGALR